MMRYSVGILLGCAMHAASVSAQDSQQHWAFKKLVGGNPPVISDADQEQRVRNPIDQFVVRRLQEAGLEAAPEASRLCLVRRGYFDLIGLPPSPAEVESFLNDDSPQAWSNLLDKLLDSNHYGERWARHWLDVVRYADSGGYETDIYYRNAWRYRDYVVQSFNEDKPYDVFVQEQIAGDELWPDNLDLDPRRVYVVSDQKRRALQARIATGLYTLGPRIHESGLDAARLTYETLTDWVDTTASAIMGLTLGCARCHEHKFDPFTQADYYSFAAIFASARELELPLWTSMEEADWRQSYPRVVAVEEARRSYRLFEQNTKGKKLSAEEQAKKSRLLARIAEAVLALPERAAGQHAVDYVGLMHIPTASVLGRKHPGLIKPVYLLERGELAKPRQRVYPALPQHLAALTNRPTELPQPFGGRKQLALWLTRPDHPLTARVIVNRIWQWHFGRGLVGTANDFGAMGQRPTHPKLLDWLASEFVAGGWKIKDLHRLIMNSAAYRRSSLFASDRHLTRDPENRLLWRMSRKRLEAEALWDAVHTVSGTINLTLGGRPVVPPLAADEIASLREKWHWVVSADPAQHRRRGIYVLVRRNFKFPMFEVFDTPLTAVSCPSRDVTTVAPQALWGLNNKSVFRQAMHFAARVLKEAGTESRAQVERAWRIALARPPSDREAESAVRLLGQLLEPKAAPLTDPPESLRSVDAARAHALSKLCLALYNLSEFSFVD